MPRLHTNPLIKGIAKAASWSNLKSLYIRSMDSSHGLFRIKQSAYIYTHTQSFSWSFMKLSLLNSLLKKCKADCTRGGWKVGGPYSLCLLQLRNAIVSKSADGLTQSTQRARNEFVYVLWFSKVVYVKLCPPKCDLVHGAELLIRLYALSKRPCSMRSCVH